MLDLFAGTGNLGIEALSRGASFAVFVEKSNECADIIKDNLIHTKLQEKSKILVSDALNALLKFGSEGRSFDLIFLDPPYNKGLIQEALTSIAKNDIIKVDGLIIAESDKDDNLPGLIENLKLERNQKYGDTVLSFYRVQ